MPSSANADSLISAALSQVNYRHPEKTKRDVLNLLHHYKGLAPSKSKFIFNDGQERELILIKGTIPVPYKGQSYNIPVSMWLLDTHPYHAPICFVTPTQDMQIKVSKHVDQAGKIYLPYLHEWANGSSDLLGLIQICIVVFSEQPPVFAKPRQPQPQPQQTPYPLYPPQYPPQQQTGPPYPPSNQGGYPGLPPYTGGYSHTQGAQQQGYPPYPTSQPSAGPAYPPYPPTSSSQSLNSQSSLSQEHIKASILSAVEDKVRRRLREEMSTAGAEIESLKRTGEELGAGQNKLKLMVGKIQAEESSLSESVGILQNKREELEKMIEQADTAGDDIPVDEVVSASTPLYKQLVSAVAEEAAIEDGLYMLGEALRRGAVDAEVFLKQVRDLARRQFLLRATIMAAREKAKLG